MEVRSPNYIFLFRLRLSRAITRCARKNPFADNALKRRAHGADSNYEHLYLQLRRFLHHPRHHIHFLFIPRLLLYCYHDVALTRVSLCTFPLPTLLPHHRYLTTHPKTSAVESCWGENIIKYWTWLYGFMVFHSIMCTVHHE